MRERKGVLRVLSQPGLMRGNQLPPHLSHSTYAEHTTRHLSSNPNPYESSPGSGSNIDPDLGLRLVP